MVLAILNLFLHLGSKDQIEMKNLCLVDSVVVALVTSTKQPILLGQRRVGGGERMRPQREKVWGGSILDR